MQDVEVTKSLLLGDVIDLRTSDYSDQGKNSQPIRTPADDRMNQSELEVCVTGAKSGKTHTSKSVTIHLSYL